jgi:hypothetical protein
MLGFLSMHEELVEVPRFIKGVLMSTMLQISALNYPPPPVSLSTGDACFAAGEDSGTVRHNNPVPHLTHSISITSEKIHS